jgi:long-chain acyl-CoA synthetase
MPFLSQKSRDKRSMSANQYSVKPWLTQYDADQPAILKAQYNTALAIFEAAVVRKPNAVCVQYFDCALTFRLIGEMSDGLAAILARNGFVANDRLALYMQNIPQFLIGLVGAWKAGGIAVPINPMNREREVSAQFSDCEPAALICEDVLYADVVERVAYKPRIVFTT